MSRLRFPGLIDAHVHLRDPGATHKEDWSSGTAAALAGGFTCVLAMPNTQPPLTDNTSLQTTLSAAASNARCDYGVYAGGTELNAAAVAALAPHTAGLKLYLNETYGPLRIEDLGALQAHMHAWPATRPLLCHAEGHHVPAAILLAMLAQRSVHICHVSRAAEIAVIRAAKARGLPVTCEVTPHHLLLTPADAAALSAGRAEVRPALNNAADQAALWQAMQDGVVDCIATDHAPHLPAEKDGPQPPPGFPGLETALALLLSAPAPRRLSHAQLVALLHTNPARIFGLQPQPDTWVEVDPQQRWEVRGADFHSRAKWSPFEGWQLTGRVQRVCVRGQLAFTDGQVLAAPGSGKLAALPPV